MYEEFAGIYDQLMAEVDYDRWAARLCALMKEAGAAPGARCVECACGTGSLTWRLARAGYRMTGVDLSGDMLRCAMEKCRDQGMTIPFVRQDMRALKVPRRVSAVLCTCDGVNYLTDEASLNRFFTAAWAALCPGGVLIFDVSTPHKLKNVLGNHTLTRAEKDFAYIWDNRWQEATRTVEMSLTLFARRPGEEKFTRVEEGQRQRAWERSELRSALQAAGFAQVRFFGRLRNTAPRTGDDRWMAVAVRPAEVSSGGMRQGDENT